jgi:LysM repeat protein
MSGSTTCGRHSQRGVLRSNRLKPSTHRSRATIATSGALEVLALLIILILLIVGLVTTSGRGPEKVVLSQRVKVQSGESLWAVAAAHPVAGMSTAQVADLLATSNDLSERLVRPGQILRVPTESANQMLAAR